MSEHTYINVTEIRGMPLIVVNFYEAVLVILLLFFLKWMHLCFKHTCCMETDNQGNMAITTAEPVRRWIEWAGTPSSTSQRSHQSLEDSDTDTEEEPTAADIRPIEGLASNE